MIDVSPKFNSLRYASAEGFLYGKKATLKKVFDKSVPKGDVTEVARAAGIFAAKRCADWITFCHPIPLDWVEVKLEPQKYTIKVSAEVRSVWKTGVEMEAITAVTAALLNAYDMLKPLDDSLSFGEIRVVRKKGGKSDFSDSFRKKIRAAVLVISDSTHAGKRKDKSGKVIGTFGISRDVTEQKLAEQELARERDLLKTIIDNVPTRMLRRPEDLAYALAHLDELVVKEVHGAGGYGMLVGPKASRAEIGRFRALIKEHPERYIAQPTLALSTCPTFVDEGVAPRHIDLRPFVLSGGDVRVVPGGLTRVALRAGSLVVNSSQGGGTKDTWVLER